MARRCGGCEGQGAHWRWCPKVVGISAHHWGVLSEQVGGAADSVGGNNPGLANQLYAASAELLEMAKERSRG